MSFQPGSNNYVVAFGTNPENVEVPHIESRAPTVNDVYPVGKRWIDLGTAVYTNLGNTSSPTGTTSNWSLLGTGTGGPLNTLSDDSAVVVTPVANNIQIAGTGSEISTTAGVGVITLSIPAAFVAPGSIASTTTLHSGTSLSVATSATIGTTLGVTGLTTLAALTQVGTANINASGTAATNIGGSSGAITVTVGAGNFSLVGAAHTVGIANDAAANIVTVGSATGIASLTLQAGTGNMSLQGAVGTTYTIGTATGTGLITIGQSTAGETVSINSAASNTVANVVNILNGATPGADTTLNVMNGAGTAGTQTVNILATGATRAGAVNIGTGAAAHQILMGSVTGLVGIHAPTTVTLASGAATGVAVDVSAGTGVAMTLKTTADTTDALQLVAGGIKVHPTSVPAGATPQTCNNRFGQVTFSGVSIASGADQAFVIDNTTVTGAATVVAVWMSGATAGSALSIESVVCAASTITITVTNGTSATMVTSVANITFTFWVMD